jgi:long-chain acyl-CoA synthetase
MYRHVLHDWRGWDLFGKLSVPTLVIRGHRDLVFQAQMFERVAEAIPGAEEVNVGASGHMVMLERRQAVNRAIQNFLEEAPASWRDAGPTTEKSHRSALVRDRPWLVLYDDGVPYTVSIPPIALHRLLRSAVRRFPLRTAVIFEGRHLTYRRLNREVNRFANALISLGMRPGDRVMLLLPNSPQLVISFYGVLKAGGVAVFTLPTTRREELIRQIRESGARTLVTLQRNAEMARAARADTDLEQIILTELQDYQHGRRRSRKYAGAEGSDPAPGTQSSASAPHEFLPLLYRHKAQSPDVHVAPDDLALIIFTGGTTDAPKGVMLSHRNLVANALQTRHWMPDAEEGRERILCVLPFTHSYGLTVGLNVGVALGATLILKPQFEVEDVLQSIRSHQPTMFPGVPNMYVAIKDFPGVRRYKVDSIRACLSGAAPLPVEVQEAFEKLTRGRLVEGYGLSEASPVTHANPIAGRRRIGSIGLPLPSTEARVVDLTNGKDAVPVGQIGELAVRGPQVMAGYWDNPEATRRVLSEDGWLLTGDVVQMNPDGFFRLIARKADMWYPEKPEEPAFPRDVEEVIYEIPQVKEAAVVAMANQPVAFIIAQPDRPSPESVLAYCRRRLPPELVPRFVVFVDDFPRTFIGKILRRELKKRYEQQHS